MKLEYLYNLSDNGKYKDIPADELVRLIEFENDEIIQFREILLATVINEGKTLVLSELDFIEAINCELTLFVTSENKGISTIDRNNLICELRKEEYEDMFHLLEPFCKDPNGYQWLCTTETPIEFLLSPGGGW